MWTGVGEGSDGDGMSLLVCSIDILSYRVQSYILYFLHSSIINFLGYCQRKLGCPYTLCPGTNGSVGIPARTSADPFT